MSCQHLVCAACAGPVAEGRCPTCRAARAHVHNSALSGAGPQAIALLAALVVLLAVLAATL